MNPIRPVVIAFIAAGAFGAAPLVHAMAPRLIPFQGRLLDEAGQPRSGTFQVTFAIYETATGGTPCWTEIQPAVPVADGQINVLLGSVTSLDTGATNCAGAPAVAFEGPRYLGVTVGTAAFVRPA
jgi:hypothetical protein